MTWRPFFIGKLVLLFGLSTNGVLSQAEKVSPLEMQQPTIEALPLEIALFKLRRESYIWKEVFSLSWPAQQKKFNEQLDRCLLQGGHCALLARELQQQALIHPGSIDKATLFDINRKLDFYSCLLSFHTDRENRRQNCHAFLSHPQNATLVGWKKSERLKALSPLCHQGRANICAHIADNTASENLATSYHMQACSLNHLASCEQLATRKPSALPNNRRVFMLEKKCSRFGILACFGLFNLYRQQKNEFEQTVLFRKLHHQCMNLSDIALLGMPQPQQAEDFIELCHLLEVYGDSQAQFWREFAHLILRL